MTRHRLVLLASLCVLGLSVGVGSAPAGPADVIPIGQVQGAVSDAQNGLTHRSPYARPTGNDAGSETVTVQGVITQKTLARTSTGGSNHGFFLQNTGSTADSDPTTSDGIFVFLGRFSTVLVDPSGTYTPQVGDEIRIRGRVSEFFNLTQLSSMVRLEEVLRTGVNLETEVPAFETQPPDDLGAANRYWERHEGMRARIPSGAIVTGKRDVFPSTADAEIWLIRGDHPLAQRSDPFTRRSFRDPHPLDNHPVPLFDDGNGYRIVLGSHGLKAAASDNTVLIAPARTFDTLQNTLTGGVYFSFSKYQIMVDQQPELAPGVDPAANAPPRGYVRQKEWAAATFNVENLYDFRDDPTDGCDFVDDPGCPGVNPPFDYVPKSDTEYQERLGELAHQIAVDLKSPDLVLVQEAEDQDLCAVGSGALACGVADDADGKPDTLQELALRIAAAGGPSYDAAYDRDGADDRGIVSAFLYRTDRVELLPASAAHPVLGSGPEVVYDGAPKPYNADVQNPKALNADLPDRVDLSTGSDGPDVFTRAPQVGLFRVWRVALGKGSFFDLYAVSNHFSSTPNVRVGQRTEQALYNARIVDAVDAANADPYVLVGGDLNVYPRPDDPFSPGDALFPSDQLGPLYEHGLTNLWDVLVAEAPASAYTYVFQGQAQTLDQLFVNDPLLAKLEEVRVAHVNADWPADFPEDGPRGASDHDPVHARFDHLVSRGRGK